MKENTKKRIIIVKNVIGIMFLLGVYSSLFMLYGPINWLRETLITTAMTTMEHKWIARIVYSDKTINDVLSASSITPPKEDTNTSYIQIKEVIEQSSYISKEEEQILKKDIGNEDYKIIPIEKYINPVHYYKGYLAVIYDPSKVGVAISKNIGTRGEYIDDMAKRVKAKLAVNASGYADPNWMGNGGQPHGIVMSKGKMIYGEEIGTVNMIGFNKDNILVLAKKTPAQALDMGIRDAVSFSPYLIINGKSSFVKGNGGWGIAPRTAIGQRKDGIVLFLTIDGRQKHSIGADMIDLTEIMEKYGAVNAANLDGGSSTALIENGILITKPTAAGKDKLRHIPDAWVAY